MARERVRDGAERAVRRARTAGELRTLEVDPPVVVEVDFAKGVIADHAAIMPRTERVGDRTVRMSSDDPETAFRAFLTVLRLIEGVSG
jgi:D-aminopeptidase